MREFFIAFFERLTKHCDFKIYLTTILCILILLGLAPGMKYLPAPYGYENGLFENIQMVLLFISCGFALKTQNMEHKKFFTFVFLVLTILILREINCGRTIFFAIPGQENAFYSWKQIKYGWLAHPIYGAYMTLVGIYFLKNKIYLNLINIIKNYKLPIWNILLMLTGMALATYAEEVTHNAIMEEITEMLFYTALCSIIYCYSISKNFLENNKKSDLE